MGTALWMGSDGGAERRGSSGKQAGRVGTRLRGVDRWAAAALGFVIASALAACGQPSDEAALQSSPASSISAATAQSPTSAPAPSPTAAPLPTSTAAPDPTATPEPPPSPTATATPRPAPNLAPYTPQGWDAPLVISGSADDDDESGLRAGGGSFVSWAVADTAGARVDGRFFIDLLFDGVTVWRWTSDLLPAGGYIDISDWPDLHRLVDIDPGTHTLTLVVDATDLVEESDETDNRVETQVEWLPPDTALPSPPSRERLPDLVPYTPAGWSGPVAANSYGVDGIDGPLSVDAPARVLAAFTNSGAASTGLNIWAHLYLDDVLVDVSVSPGLLVDDVTRRLRIDDLHERTAISPGEHTLRLVIDPTDLVEESDETNNVFERRVTWMQGEPPPRVADTQAAAAYPTPPALPNLVPGWRFGWDGPIVVSQERGTSLDAAPVLGRTAYIDLAVANLSTVEPPQPFSVDLYFDEQKVRSFRFSPDSQSGGETLLDWAGLTDAVEPTPGRHVLKLVIDPENAIEETDETDNTFEKAVTWQGEPSSPPQPTTYSDDELRWMLRDLRELIGIGQPAFEPGGPDRREDVLRVAEAGYFLLTGRSMRDERLTVELLPSEEYTAWVDEDFVRSFAVTAESDYAALVRSREMMKEHSLGLKTRRLGEVAVVVDAGQDIDAAINSLAHELGHAVQDFVNPGQTEEVLSLPLQGLREAQAHQFQRAFWLKLEEFTGLDLLTYPDIGPYRAYVAEQVYAVLLDAGSSEHRLAILVQWAALMKEAELEPLRTEVLTNGRLDANSAMAFFEYLVSIPVDEVSAKVEQWVTGAAFEAGAIVGIGIGRLAPEDDVDFEGPPGLRSTKLLMP